MKTLEEYLGTEYTSLSHSKYYPVRVTMYELYRLDLVKLDSYDELVEDSHTEPDNEIFFALEDQHDLC